MTPSERIHAHAAIADDLCSRIEEFVARGNQGLKQSGYKLTVRDHVMIGLVLKIDSSFRAFLVDARAERIESLHHLKTMVEAFVYLHIVGKDQSDRTAEGLLCHVYQKREQFYRLNPSYDFEGGLLRLANDARSFNAYRRHGNTRRQRRRRSSQEQSRTRAVVRPGVPLRV